MKTRIVLPAVIILAGMTSAAPHPKFTAACTILLRHHAGTPLDLNNAQRLDFDAPLIRLGDQIVTCQADLGPGPATVLNFATTGDTCDLDLGPGLTEPIAKTKVWTETIKANGEATLICDFGPRP